MSVQPSWHASQLRVRYQDGAEFKSVKNGAGEDPMAAGIRNVSHWKSGALATAAAAMLTVLAIDAGRADDPPYALAREGFFYVGGKPVTVGGRTYIAGQMYVDVRIPAKQTHPYPIIMVHGGTRSATTYLGTADGREGWATYFVRHGDADYVVDKPGHGRTSTLADGF